MWYNESCYSSDDCVTVSILPVSIPVLQYQTSAKCEVLLTGCLVEPVNLSAAIMSALNLPPCRYICPSSCRCPRWIIAAMVCTGAAWHLYHDTPSPPQTHTLTHGHTCGFLAKRNAILVRRWRDVGLASPTLAQYRSNDGWTSRIRQVRPQSPSFHDNNLPSM